ncbi:MAG TPA: 5-deoxy-glucuronate isomerase, partial [Casimicrobiaceae bacterium]
MSLLVKARPGGRDIVHVTPRSAGWRYVGFSAHRLASGESMTIDRPDDELCIVVLGGTVTVAQREGAKWAGIGQRRDVFDDSAPYAVYLPGGRRVEVTAHSAAEIGIASAPGPGNAPARLIEPTQMKR